MSDKTAINAAVQARYDELMAEGKHGHYETLFRIVHEQRAAGAEAMRLAARAKVREIGEQQEAAGHYGATSVAAVIVAALITLPLPEPK